MSMSESSKALEDTQPSEEANEVRLCDLAALVEGEKSWDRKEEEEGRVVLQQAKQEVLSVDWWAEQNKKKECKNKIIV